MPQPVDSSQPRLASGCRWGTHQDEPVVLFPEGMIRVKGTSQSILELCDGQRTVTQIVAALAAKYNGSDPVKIRADVVNFLESLQRKRIVDY